VWVHIKMTNLTIDGRDADQTTFIPLADDDGVWLVKASRPRELVDLLENPYAWVSKVPVSPKGEATRPAKLLENFVISMNVSTTPQEREEPAASYVVDGIDETGFITVRMSSFGGRFQFKSGIDLPAAEKEILALDLEFVFAQAGERGFVHLPLGNRPHLRRAMICGAIENQEWLLGLYNKLALKKCVVDGNELDSPRPLRFSFERPGVKTGLLSQAPQLDIIVQGNQCDLNTIDACNIGVGTVLEEEFYMDTLIWKAYAPATTSTTASTGS